VHGEYGHRKAEDVIVRGFCYDIAMEKEADFPIDERHIYKSSIPFETRIEDIECTCKGELEIACKRILPTATNTERVIVYNSCKRTLFAALKRQLKKVIPPNPNVAKELNKFMDIYFEKYIKEHLDTFDYSYSEWFNEMPRNKQDALNLRDKTIPDNNTYGIFCKREKQQFGGKNRAISNISQEAKYLTGPVIWALESIADKNFPGYCGKKNWNDIETFFSRAYKRGFRTVIQGDGSAFDLSQHYENKYIDRLIHSYLADNNKIHHADPDDYKRVMNARFRKMRAQYVEHKKLITLATAKIDSTVFSGSTDTTFGNTLRMAIYNMFTLEQAGLRYEEDYLLLCKGDDFLILVKDDTLNYQAIYDKYWCKPIKNPQKHDYTPYGIGVILKFLKIGDYSTLDFCSTICIPDFEQGIFKLARKPTRMNPLAHYSRAALSMSAVELKQYLMDQAMAIRISMPNMPFFEDYADAFEYHANLIEGTPVLKTQGRVKLVLEDDHHKKTGVDKETKYITKYQAYERDFAMGLALRESETQISRELVYKFFLDKFGMTQQYITKHATMLKSNNILPIYDILEANWVVDE